MTPGEQARLDSRTTPAHLVVEEPHGERFDLALDLLLWGHSVTVAGYRLRATVDLFSVEIPATSRLTADEASRLLREAEAWTYDMAARSVLFRLIAERPCLFATSDDTAVALPVCCLWEGKIRWPRDEPSGAARPWVRDGPPRPLVSTPVLIGGLDGLQKRVRYPCWARLTGAGGRVVVGFVVGPDGVPADIGVRESVGRALDAEAVRVISESRFEPGVQLGKLVSVPCTLPIAFNARGVRQPTSGNVP